MLLLRKIFYWLLGLAFVVALAGLIAIWGVLGVNPFESDQDELWQLTSYHVNFFVRFPGTRLLKDRFVRNLEQDAELRGLGNLREDLEKLTAQIARETAGQLPFGQTIDFERDFVGREMAIAGRIEGDYHKLRVDNFVLLTRIASYAKFISALKRGFVRDRIPDGDRIELVKGLYFRIKVDEQTRRTLDSFRSQRGGMGPRDEIFLARIRDVVIISDNAQWIEDAIAGGEDVLPADAWFESEFIRTSRGGNAVEAFFRLDLTSHALQAHSREEGTLVHALEKLVPIAMAGDMTVRLQSRGGNQLKFELSDLPGKNRFTDIKQYLRQIYNAEKVDLRTELGPEGIGRFIPKDNVVGAMVLRVNPEQLVDVLLSLMPQGYKTEFDEEVRRSSKGRWPSFERLLRHLSEDLSDTHLIVFHRPTVFEKAPWDVYWDPWDGPETPDGQVAISVVSRMKDSVAPTAIEQKLLSNLPNLGLLSKGTNKEFAFRQTSPTIRAEELQLFDPAFGALAGRYFFLSTMVETAEALNRAARDEDQRLLSDDRFAAMVASLPRTGTLGMILNGPVLRSSLYDTVREWATARMGTTAERGRIADELRASNKKMSDDDIADEIDRRIVKFKEDRYDDLRREYAKLLQPLDSVDGIALVVSLGVGPENKIKAEGTLFLAGDDAPEEDEDGLE